MTHVLLIGHSHITCVITGFLRMADPQVTMDFIYLRDHKMVGGEKKLPCLHQRSRESTVEPAVGERGHTRANPGVAAFWCFCLSAETLTASSAS